MAFYANMSLIKTLYYAKYAYTVNVFDKTIC